MKKRARSFTRFVDRLNATGLLGEITTRALKHRVSLRELYDGAASQSVVKARTDVYAQLAKKGKSVIEIGRMFDRAPNGVLKLLKKGAS